MNIVLVTSVINICNKKLDYSNVRSFCDKEKRLSDTLKTIESIRKYIPDSKILLVECSDIEETFLRSVVDYFINLKDDEDVLSKVNSESKSKGETILTIKGIEYLQKNNIQYNNFFKISGRYWLNDKFNYSLFDNKSACVRYINNNYNIITTVVYKLPKDAINDFLNFLKNTENTDLIYNGYELIFALFVNNSTMDKVIIHRLGVNGFVSVDGRYIDI
jgi:hypothetical protein